MPDKPEVILDRPTPTVDTPEAYSSEAWRNTWKIMKESPETRFQRFGINMWYWLDRPVTWFREKIVEPNWKKYKGVYYHQHFGRGPRIDECRVGDAACIYEANFQFRLDRNVDSNILKILRMRLARCMDYYGIEGMYHCRQAIEDFEESELNYFIKYCELSLGDDVRTAYMKQKHRLIWERRHPEIMEERKKQYEEHKTEMEEGYFNIGFWKADMWHLDKTKIHSRMLDRHPVGSTFGRTDMTNDWTPLTTPDSIPLHYPHVDRQKWLKEQQEAREKRAEEREAKKSAATVDISHK